jgi:arsenate reductase-like glutaredoxin family protein
VDVDKMKINHINYIKKSEAKNKLKSIYKHIEENFGKLVEPIVLHSINTELTLSVWSVLYETVLVSGEIKRSLKEAVATCISEINKCQYCVDAHSIMIFGTEKELYKTILTIKNGNTILESKADKIMYWAISNFDFENSIIENPPFNRKEAPEIIGTAILFHYINRMVSIFAGYSPLPISIMKEFISKFVSTFIFSKAINKSKFKGESLLFIESKNQQFTFDWANESPEISKAFQYLKCYSRLDVDKIISSELIENLMVLSTNLHLLMPTLGKGDLERFLSKVKLSEKKVAEYCYLIMFESYKIEGKHIHYLKQEYTDEEILLITSLISFLIAEEISNKLYRL